MVELSKSAIAVKFSTVDGSKIGFYLKEYNIYIIYILSGRVVVTKTSEYSPIIELLAHTWNAYLLDGLRAGKFCDRESSCCDIVGTRSSGQWLGWK